MAPGEPKSAPASRSASPPLRRGNGGRPRRRGAGALWGAVRAQPPKLMVSRIKVMILQHRHAQEERRSGGRMTCRCMAVCRLERVSIAIFILDVLCTPCQLLLAGAYYLLVRRPPSATRQAVLAGLRDAARESLLAASEMTRCLAIPSAGRMLLIMLAQVLRPLPAMQARHRYEWVQGVIALQSQWYNSCHAALE